MAYDAKVIEIIIASPSDVSEERGLIREVVGEWNSIYARDRGTVLLPVGWETHSSPELSGRPQQLINDRLLVHADILIGVFWTRIGSPTGKAISGSIEEVNEHHKQGKPVMLYFSNAPVAPDKIDHAQYEQLKIFKAWALGEGLVESYNNVEDFRDKLRRQLPLTLRDNTHIQKILVSAQSAVGGTDVKSGLLPTLSADALELLRSAAASQHGDLLIMKHIGGTTIQSGGSTFGDSGNRRSVARWEAAVRQLLESSLITDVDGEGVSFQLNNAGYELVELET